MYKISGLAVGLSMFASVAAAAPVQWTVASGGNGHYYEFIGDDAGESLLTFEDAYAAAEASSFAGLDGHLATITSAEEQDFLESLLGTNEQQYYIGGSDAETEGAWKWVAGPETGTLFGSVESGTYTPIGYDNWAEFEPNDFNGEDFASFNFFFGDGARVFGEWNDLPSFELGYLVEYSDVAPVPLPASLPLLLLGGAAFGLVKRRRRT